MVYHEVRIVNGKKQHYLIYNKREDGKWVKKSKFIGQGRIERGKIIKLKKDLKLSEYGLINRKTNKFVAGRTEEEVEQYIREWNKHNPEELRETYFIPQLKHSKGQDKLPPNCSNEGYMKAIGICQPDDFCRKIKNPANYALLKYKIYGQTEKKKKIEAKPKKTEKKEKENKPN